MSGVRISLDEYLAELDKVTKGNDFDDGFMSTTEMVESTGKNRRTICHLLIQAKKVGRLDTKRVLREGLDGLPHPLTIYRIKAIKKNNKSNKRKKK